MFLNCLLQLMGVGLDSIARSEALYFILVRWGAIGWTNRCICLLLWRFSYYDTIIYLNIPHWFIELLLILAFMQLSHTIAIIWQEFTLERWSFRSHLRSGWRCFVLLGKHRIHLYLAIWTCRYDLLTRILKKMFGITFILVERIRHLDDHTTLTSGWHLSRHIVANLTCWLFQISCWTEIFVWYALRFCSVWIRTW